MLEDKRDHDMLEGDELLIVLKNRQLNVDQIRIIEELHLFNAKTSVILNAVNAVKNAKAIAIPKDITNYRTNIRQASNEGVNLKNLALFIKELGKRGYTIAAQLDANDETRIERSKLT